ncbi:fumarate hydratase [Anaerobaca lacustris]|uniref:Fumarate hydratase n=1 Tax=Anaerobaca lacustris TaxID=3044600 RepID=A0AAW6TS85_9BACT|nr:fumarate hydratase [Sedimentisphaerales bacterium M17dextr]
MRTIEFEQVRRTVESLCIAACYELPDDVRTALEAAAAKESNPPAAKILAQLLDNARIAADERIPLCQDTGLTVVFVEQGAELVLPPPSQDGPATLHEAVNEGVQAGYENGFLRKSVVADPLHARTNTQTNAPAILHHIFVPGDKLRISVMAKGGGCENKSQFRMFRPTAEASDVADWIVEVVRSAGADACPPFVVGVGIGGNFESSCLLSKTALLRSLGEPHPDGFYAQMERELMARINALGIGPLGLGGDTTALGVQIETAPCHIASLPVAVNIECHSHRHKTAIL